MYEGGERLNLPYIADANTSSSPPYGCTKCHVTLDERGARQSTFAAFLPADLVQSRKEVPEADPLGEDADSQTRPRHLRAGC